jgi:hypothetical protein
MQIEFLYNHCANELTKFIKNLKNHRCSFDHTPSIYMFIGDLATPTNLSYVRSSIKFM